MRTELPCLPLIQERFWNTVKDEYKQLKCYPEFSLIMFPQTWGSTTLGFLGFGGIGGIGSQAITKAYTTVVYDDCIGWAGVFFGEKLAYIISNPNQLFFDDLMKQNMEDVIGSEKYRRHEP